MTSKSGPFTIHEATEIIRLLTQDRLILVGGQAVNYWAERFREEDPQLAQLAPFISADIDFLGHIEDAEAVAQKFNGVARYPGFEQVNTPEIAVVDGFYKDKPLRIDFLGGVIGPSNVEIRRSAVKIADAAGQTSFLALHPLHLLECRLANVTGVLKRTDEQSIRQLKAAIRIARNYIRHTAIESLDENGPRQALNQIERIFEIADDDQAYMAKSRHGIDILDAVPREIFDQLPPQFAQKRWPHFLEHLKIHQDRFAAALAKNRKE